MKKIQKIWLGIFLAMFIVPEVLWSPVLNYIYVWNQNGSNLVYLRPNMFTNNVNLWSYILLFQFISLILIGIDIIFLRKHFKNEFLFWILLFILIASAVVVFGMHILVNFSQHVKINSSIP